MAYSDDDARTWFNVNQGAGDNDIRKAMEQYGIGFDQIARVTGVSRDEVQTRYNAARNSDPTLKPTYVAPAPAPAPSTSSAPAPAPTSYTPASMVPAPTKAPAPAPTSYTPASMVPAPTKAPAPAPASQKSYSDDEVRTWFNVNQGAGDNDIRKAMEQYGIGFDQIARVTGVSRDEVKTRYNAARNSDPTLKQSYIAPSVSAVPPVGDLVQDRVRSWFESNPLASDFEIAQAMKKYGVGPGLVSSVTGLPLDQVNNRYAAALANPSAGLNEAPETGINLSRLQDTTKWDVAPDQTVFAQLQKVLASDSPLMQMARTRAMQDASSRGLLNSSMAGTAGEAALYDAAMPIATADAGTYAGAAQFNAGASNDFARDNNAFTREAFMAEYNLAANEWAKRQDQQRTLDAMSIDQQYMLDRDAIQNGYQSARDAIANGWQIERDATTQQYTLQRDSQQNQYTLERDAIQNGYQQASTSQDQANVDADRRFNALSNLTSLKTDFQTQLMNIGTNYEGDAETEKAQNLWNSYKPLIEQWAVLAGLDPTTQTAGIAPVAKEAA